MAIIDPAGLFQGDRLSRCSDDAQLYWPRYYLASNSVARLELNYDNLCSSAFKSLRTRPSREQFAAHIREYNEHYLLFIYQANGSVWGQWSTDKRNLPRFSTRDARRSPAPPDGEFEKWCDEYATIKATEGAKEFLGLLKKNGVVPAIHRESVEITESTPEITVNTPNSQRVTETRGDSPRGGGVGVGVGIGVGVGGGFESPQNPPNETEITTATPEGLHQLEYARCLLEDLGLPAARGMLEMVAGSISSFAKSQNITKAVAFEAIRRRALDDQAQGEQINRFWFEDAKYGVNRNGKRKGNHAQERESEHLNDLQQVLERRRARRAAGGSNGEGEGAKKGVTVDAS